MRAAGIDEALITGSAEDSEKYEAWAKTVPQCIGNPLYHWTHLELKRPFGFKNIIFGPHNSEEIWNHCHDLLAKETFRARGIMNQMNVKMVGTTDDPVDSLEHHKRIFEDTQFDIDVLPTWRPDKIFKIAFSEFPSYIDDLENVTGKNIKDWDSLLEVLSDRIHYFNEHNCCSADHGIERLNFENIPNTSTLSNILSKGRSQSKISEIEVAQFQTALHIWMAEQYVKYDWVMQLHIGAIRDNNQKMFRSIGANAGFDSIGDRNFAEPLSKLLSEMELNEHLPITILYCLNARDNDVIATMIGNFQGGGIPGKIQFGSAWWFNDQKNGMLAQLNSLANMGLLSRFVGMLTDSRSFLSYTRHEYFRRILCNMLGEWMEQGELPHDFELVGSAISDICSNNAVNYFKFKRDNKLSKANTYA
jgi:glucuronate isomerase